MGLFQTCRQSLTRTISQLKLENMQLKNSLEASKGLERQHLRRIDAKYSERPLVDDPRVRLLVDVVARLVSILESHDRHPGQYTAEQFVMMVRNNLGQLFSDVEKLKQDAERYAAECDAEDEKLQTNPDWQSAEDTFSFRFGYFR